MNIHLFIKNYKKYIFQRLLKVKKAYNNLVQINLKTKGKKYIQISFATMLQNSIFVMLQPGTSQKPVTTVGKTFKTYIMKNQSEKIQLNLEDLQLESFVTSIDSEVAKRLSGGLGNVSEPTHTEITDDHHTPPAKCTGVLC